MYTLTQSDRVCTLLLISWWWTLFPILEFSPNDQLLWPQWSKFGLIWSTALTTTIIWVTLTHGAIKATSTDPRRKDLGCSPIKQNTNNGKTTRKSNPPFWLCRSDLSAGVAGVDWGWEPLFNPLNLHQLRLVWTMWRFYTLWSKYLKRTNSFVTNRFPPSQ